MEPSVASSEAVPVRLEIAAAGEAPEASSVNFAPPVPVTIGWAKSSDRGAEVGVGEFATRVQLEVSANIGRADLALEAPAISRSLH